MTTRCHRRDGCRNVSKPRHICFDCFSVSRSLALPTTTLKDHLRTTAHCTRCINWRRRTHRVSHPGSWWCQLGAGTVYGPPALAGGGGILGEEGHHTGNTTETKTLSEKTETKTEDRHTEVTVQVGSSVTLHCVGNTLKARGDVLQSLIKETLGIITTGALNNTHSNQVDPTNTN